MKWTVIAAALGVCAVAAVTASAQGHPRRRSPASSSKLDAAPGFWNGRASGTTIRNPSG